MGQGYPGKYSQTLLRERIKVETNSCLFSQLSVALSCVNRQENLLQIIPTKSTSVLSAETMQPHTLVPVQ